VSEGDVDGLLDQLGEPATELSDEPASFLRELLDPHGERTLRPGVYWPGAGDEPRRTYGLGGRTRRKRRAERHRLARCGLLQVRIGRVLTA